MAEVMRAFGNSHETIALILGVVEILVAVLFFLQKFGIFTLTYVENIPDMDMYYLYFFAGLALVSGIIHLFTTLGFIGTH